MAIFLEKDLSYRLVGCFYDIRNKYGRGHNERVYDRVLDEQMKIKGIQFVDKPKIPIYSVDTGRIISFYVPDKLVGGKILVEIKAKPIVGRSDKQQTREYLQTSTYEIIYLVNFGEESFRPQRFILTNDHKRFIKYL